MSSTFALPFHEGPFDPYIPNVDELVYDCGYANITIPVNDTNLNSVAYDCGYSKGGTWVGLAPSPKDRSFFNCGYYNITIHNSSAEIYRVLYECGYFFTSTEQERNKKHKSNSPRLVLPKLWILVLLLVQLAFIAC
ncbi:hypothetical protein G9P44_002962 [Scheffersomyces stipitis]|nr:hypothetical protein G9P44_002962 [Scheffersomyces stipitis]